MTGDLGRYRYSRLISPPGLTTPTGDHTQQDEYRGGRLALRLRSVLQCRRLSISHKAVVEDAAACLFGASSYSHSSFMLVAAAVVAHCSYLSSEIRNQHNATAPATTQAGQVLRPSRARMVACHYEPRLVVQLFCTNGFTGSHCATSSDADCMTTEIAGTSNATIGSGYPRLLNDAQNNFSMLSTHLFFSSLLLYQSQLYI